MWVWVWVSTGVGVGVGGCKCGFGCGWVLNTYVHVAVLSDSLSADSVLVEGYMSFL